MADYQRSSPAPPNVAVAADELRTELRRAADEYELAHDPAAAGVLRALSWLAMLSTTSPSSFEQVRPTAAQAAAELADARRLSGQLEADDDYRWWCTGVAAALAWATGESAELPEPQIAAAFAALPARSGVPDWARPGAVEVLMTRGALGSRSRPSSGPAVAMIATLDWVTGRLAVAPITGSRQQASEAAARVELLTALKATGRRVDDSEYKVIGATPRKPLAVTTTDYARGAVHVLAWLLGLSDQSPVDLRRSSDSQVAAG
jgi:hypothetical protein